MISERSSAIQVSVLSKYRFHVDSNNDLVQYTFTDRIDDEVTNLYTPSTSGSS